MMLRWISSVPPAIAIVIAGGTDEIQRNIIGVSAYLDLIADTNLLTVDKMGPNATILNGQVGSVASTPVTALCNALADAIDALELSRYARMQLFQQFERR